MMACMPEASGSMACTTSSVTLAKPLHLQRLERAMRLDHFLNYVDDILNESSSSDDDSSDPLYDEVTGKHIDGKDVKFVNGLVTTAQERKADKMRLFNFSKVRKRRKWLKNVLLSESSESSSDEEDETITEEDLQFMLKMHHLRRRHQTDVYTDKELLQYQYYSVGLLSNHDRFPEHQKLILAGKKKGKEKTKEKKIKAKLRKSKKSKHSITEAQILEELQRENLLGSVGLRHLDESIEITGPPPRRRKSAAVTEASLNTKRRKLWVALAKKEVPRAQKQKVSAHKEMLTNCRRMAQACQREIRKRAIQSQKAMKETASRARRLTREMLHYWKRYEKVEKEHRRRAEKEAQEQLKMDIELREAKRQQRKLNFLITQTELYAHFMSRKMGSSAGSVRDLIQEKILSQLDEGPVSSRGLFVGEPSALLDVDGDDYDSEEMKLQALRNAKEAFNVHMQKTNAFDCDVSHSVKIRTSEDFRDEFRLTNPSLSTDQDRPQPKIFNGVLKVYQLKGMNWLANLYDQGINGILADEMGLGKTVQSIAFFAHIAESQDIWGPFLVIAPASTLHNWQQEFCRFVPKFKVLPYWGNTSDRKVLRKFWNHKDLHTEDASFHVLITSYQLVVQDVRYFQRIKWQYMVLDEAQAIKSSSSVRWKILLGFNCRNRLLLTGTPIQNSMAELWALLHFIMPTLFDSHEEFNEWFSKDIESHAENKSAIDEKHLSRLHLILKPFMLRRIKKDVEHELSDKIEILLYCHLTTRQKRLYDNLKKKITIEDLIFSAGAASPSQAQSATSSLMNLVMQFRKVCNHPELFERRDVKSPFLYRPDQFVLPKLVFRDGLLDSAFPSRQRIIQNQFNIFTPHYIQRSLFPEDSQGNTDSFGGFSFSRFVNLSPKELAVVMFFGLLARWLLFLENQKDQFMLQHEELWNKDGGTRHLGRRGLRISAIMPTSCPIVASSPTLSSLIFVTPVSTIYTHTTHRLHSMLETSQHRDIRTGRAACRRASGGTLNSPPLSPSFQLPKPYALHSFGAQQITGVHHKGLLPRELPCQPTELPKLHFCLCPKAVALPSIWHCSDRSAAWKLGEPLSAVGTALAATLPSQRHRDQEALTWLFGSPSIAMDQLPHRYLFFPSPPGGIMGTRPPMGWSPIIIPDKETLVTDSGKLHVLDGLLCRLKSQGHRVLIYSQMTRMIDLLEEYMWHRKHTYMRLDGSSKISDRRDMVANFQSRSDIFVFLLSTRAGGLGINLTAADTVVFYDSDWNPTVDQQAMDRAHRLGQTKQVTVYRLVCKGTVEERILQRAREKSEIQRMVISGGHFKPDTLKPKEVVSLLLDDDELERKFKQRQAERKLQEEQLATQRERDKKRRTGDKRGGGRSSGKRPRDDVTTVATPTHDAESVVSVDSPPSSPSERSVSSTPAPIQEDTSNEGSLVVDDGQATTVNPTSLSLTWTGAGAGGDAKDTKPSKISWTSTSGSVGASGGSWVSGGRTRGRGRPKGSGRRGGRGRGATLAAAEIAGAHAGVSAAYAAYGYSLQSSSGGAGGGSATPIGRGGSRPLLRGASSSSASASSSSKNPIKHPKTPAKQRFSMKTAKGGGGGGGRATKKSNKAATHHNPVANSGATSGMGFYLQHNS